MNLLSRSISNAPARRPGRCAVTGLAAAALFLTACGPSAPPASEPTPTPAATPTATPVAAATATAAATPTPEVAKYNGAQQMEYNRQAVDAFVGIRAEKSQPYIEAHNALEAAGSVGAKGLTSKEAIAARRDLVAKCIAANDIYLDFVKAQETTYRTELAKTPLLPGDIDSLVNDFATRANTAAIVKLRETERETLQAGDEMLASLDKSYGDWSVNSAGAPDVQEKGRGRALRCRDAKIQQIGQRRGENARRSQQSRGSAVRERDANADSGRVGRSRGVHHARTGGEADAVTSPGLEPIRKNPPAVATALRRRVCAGPDTATERRGYSRNGQISG